MAKPKKRRRTVGVHHGPTILELAARDKELGYTDYSSESEEAGGAYTTVPEELDSMYRDQELQRVQRQAMRWIEQRQSFSRWKLPEVAAGKQLFNHYILDSGLPDSVLEMLTQSQIQEVRTQFAILCLGNRITGLAAQDTDWYRHEEPMARATRDLRRSSNTRRHAA